MMQRVRKWSKDTRNVDPTGRPSTVRTDANSERVEELILEAEQYFGGR
jgi:hypothetical protein